MRALAVFIASIAVVCSAAPPPAPGGSILYLKSGKLWVTSPDGTIQHAIPHAGTFDNPSQADDGTILAQRDIKLYRLNRQGKQLNEPITTAFRISAIIPTIKGPFWPEISPDGKKVAYTYSLVAQHFDPNCNCNVSTPSLNTTYTYSDRFVEDPVATFGNARMYARASWIDSNMTLMTTPELYNFAGDVLNTVAVDTLGGGPDSARGWFGECDPCDSVLTLKLYPLDEGEMTRQRDKLVFVSGELGTKNLGTRLAIYKIKGLPPSPVPTPCFYSGASGKFTSPTWSPDGRSLAWEDAQGIWVGTLGDIGGKSCQISKRLLVPGGSAPDWGPAAP